MMRASSLPGIIMAIDVSLIVSLNFLSPFHLLNWTLSKAIFYASPSLSLSLSLSLPLWHSFP